MPHPVDIHVGRKVRELRLARGLSQQELAEKIGVSFQQLQKYERASNRISCGRLADISAALHIPIEEFFRLETVENPTSDDPEGLAESDKVPPRRVLALARRIENVTDPSIRRQLVLLIDACSKA